MIAIFHFQTRLLLATNPTGAKANPGDRDRLALLAKPSETLSLFVEQVNASICDTLYLLMFDGNYASARPDIWIA
jgi:hypothetical protein